MDDSIPRQEAYQRLVDFCDSHQILQVFPYPFTLPSPIPPSLSQGQDGFDNLMQALTTDCIPQ